MNTPKPLDPQLARLFAQEPVPEPSSTAKDRVRARLEERLLARPEAAARTTSRGAPRLGRTALLLLAATFVGAALAASGATLALRAGPAPSPTERPAPSLPAPVPSSSVPVVPASALPDQPSPPVLASPLPKPSARPSATAVGDSAETLNEEQRMLDDARRRLAAGEADEAITRLNTHARSFPAGRLVEEREALAVQALVNAGRFDEARTRGDGFRARWPKSVYLPAVDTTLRSIP